MSVLSNESFYWAKETAEDINGIPARYTVDFEGNAICTHSFSLEHVFDDATSVDSYGLYMAFYNCTGITGSISFPELTSIDNYGLSYAFCNCKGITGSVSFPKLTSVGTYGLYEAFYNCTGITGSISFPELTSIDNYGLYDAFYNCTGITELHFRSDMQSTIGSNKYGATNATVYFDL